jgi:hypothetical protein
MLMVPGAGQEGELRVYEDPEPHVSSEGLVKLSFVEAWLGIKNFDV